MMWTGHSAFESPKNRSRRIKTVMIKKSQSMKMMKMGSPPLSKKKQGGEKAMAWGVSLIDCYNNYVLISR